MQKNWIRIVMVLVAGGISGQSSAAVKEKTKVSSSYDVQTDVQKKEDGLGQREVAQKQKGITQRMWTFVKTHKWKFLLGGMLARYLYLEKEKWFSGWNSTGHDCDVINVSNIPTIDTGPLYNPDTGRNNAVIDDDYNCKNSFILYWDWKEGRYDIDKKVLKNSNVMAKPYLIPCEEYQNERSWGNLGHVASQLRSGMIPDGE